MTRVTGYLLVGVVKRRWWQRLLRRRPRTEVVASGLLDQASRYADRQEANGRVYLRLLEREPEDPA